MTFPKGWTGVLACMDNPCLRRGQGANAWPSIDLCDFFFGGRARLVAVPAKKKLDSSDERTRQAGFTRWAAAEEAAFFNHAV